MINFRRFTILFFILLMGLNLWMILSGKKEGSLFGEHATMLYSLLFSFYLGISVTLAFLPCTGFHHPVICSGKTSEKVISLTFDDGPDPQKTPLILDILARHEVKASFFCIGKRVILNETLIERIDQNGHLVGNHSFSHSAWFDLFSSGRMRRELEQTGQAIKKVTGKSPLFFRPPYGVVNPMVSNALKKLPLHAVCWDVRSLDTLKGDPEKIAGKIIRKLRPGSIILLHDHTTFATGHLEQLIYRIKDAGYRIVPLDELIKLPAYA